MGNFYTDKHVVIDFQDDGHTGKIHDAASQSTKHFGLFLFDLGDSHPLYTVFRLILNVSSYISTVPDGQPLYKVIAGCFSYMDLLPAVGLLDQAALVRCGWTPIEVPEGSTGLMKQCDRVVLSEETSKVILDFTFPYIGRYLGFLIDPFVTNDGTNKHFDVEFYRSHAIESMQPLLKVQESVVSIDVMDGSLGKDDTNHLLSPVRVDKSDRGQGFDAFKSSIPLDMREHGGVIDRSRAIRLRGTDSSVNYSMLIHYINVSDNGRLVEVYGFNGYTERYYYPDTAFSLERQNIKKLNVVTWSGLLVEFPWAAMLWYGEIIYFADQEEFGECCRLYFKEHGNDKCPVCGNPLEWQLKYSFIDVTRVPHQIWFCSKDCMKRFNGNMRVYLGMLTKPNLDYLLEIKL